MNSNVPGPDVLDQLGALPAHDVGPAAAERIRARALQELQRRPSPWERLGRLYTGVLEPALLATVTVVYLGWAFQSAAAILVPASAAASTATVPAAAGLDQPG